MNIEQKVGLHNEFLFEVVDKNTGEIKQTAKAYNMILDQMYTRICNFNSYFVNIHFGTGTGTQSTTRTSLFTHLGTKTATDVELKKDVANNSIYWKRLIQLMPEEYVGSTITEVGIAYGSTNTNLVTHALIKDSVGNQISITKTDTDVINIYATVYVVLSNSYNNVAWTTTNELVNYLVGNTTFPTMYWHFGKIGDYDSVPIYPLICASKLGSSASIATSAWTKDTTNKKITTPISRIDVNTANGTIREIGFGSTDSSGILRMCLPITGVYTSDTTTNEYLGTGDGVTKTWNIANPDATITELKIDNTIVTGTSNNINLQPNIKLKNPSILPSNGANNCAFSSDGTYLAVVTSTNARYLSIYKRNGDSFTKINDPDVMPTSSANGCSFSSDGVYLAVSVNTPPNIYIYKRSGDTFTKLSDPDVLPSGNGSDCMFSSDGNYLVYAGRNEGKGIIVYKRTNDTFTKIEDPSVYPSTSYACAVSPNGVYFAVSDNTYYSTIYLYKRSGDTLTQMTDINVYPTGETRGFAFSQDTNYLAVAHSTSPYVSIYKRTGDAFTKLSNPDVLPTGTGYDCVFSSDTNRLFVAHAISPCITMYQRSGDTFTKLSDPDVLPPASTITAAYGVSITSDGSYLSVTHENSPRVTNYKACGQQTSVTFDTPPALGTMPKASYTVDYIPKDTNRVIDLAFTIQFGEVV